MTQLDDVEPGPARTLSILDYQPVPPSKPADVDFYSGIVLAVCFWGLLGLVIPAGAMPKGRGGLAIFVGAVSTVVLTLVATLAWRCRGGLKPHCARSSFVDSFLVTTAVACSFEAFYFAIALVNLAISY